MEGVSPWRFYGTIILIVGVETRVIRAAGEFRALKDVINQKGRGGTWRESNYNSFKVGGCLTRVSFSAFIMYNIFVGPNTRQPRGFVCLFRTRNPDRNRMKLIGYFLFQLWYLKRNKVMTWLIILEQFIITNCLLPFLLRWAPPSKP